MHQPTTKKSLFHPQFYEQRSGENQDRIVDRKLDAAVEERRLGDTSGGKSPIRHGVIRISACLKDPLVAKVESRCDIKTSSSPNYT